MKTNGNKMTERVEALETRVMGELEQVNKKLLEQDGVLSKLATPITHTQPSEPKWTEVVRRPKGVTASRRVDMPAVNATAEKRSGSGNVKRSMKSSRARPLFKMVTQNEENFPELLKTIRRTINSAVTRDAIANMCKTINGKLLVEINGRADAAETVREDVRSLCPTAKVRRMTDESPNESVTWTTRQRAKRCWAQSSPRLAIVPLA